MKDFKELLRISFKSEDTEEWLDVYFTRPIGLVFALLWNRLGVHPNAITVLSILLGIVAGWMFHYTDLQHNIMGVVLLMLANFCDSTDGQMARITGKKTLVGRMLDGFASDVWFFCVYVAISVRLMNDPMPLLGFKWGILIWILCTAAGIYGHARPCALADYYRQIHLYFLLGKEGSELNTYREQRDIYEKARRERNFTAMAFYFNYANYCHGQEQRTPQFQQFMAAWQQHSNEAVRQEFLRGSRPLMPYTNILTHNTRAFALFVSALINIPWLYPLFELIVLQGLMVYMHRRHEALCAKLTDKLQTAAPTPHTPHSTSHTAYLLDFGGTIDTDGIHWGQMFWNAYQRHGIPVTEAQFREAYVHAERTLGKNPIIKPDFTFRHTWEEKLRLQFDYLLQTKALAWEKIQVTQVQESLADELYEHVCQTIAQNRLILQALSEQHKLALVTNFYGNMATVLKEFQLDEFFESVTESAVAGVRKPDPQIFILAAQRLGIQPSEAVVVGDSYDKDIQPAKQAGFHTVWLKGEGWTEVPADTSAADRIITHFKQLS